MWSDLRVAKRVLTAFDQDGSALVVAASRINMHVGQCVFLTKVAGRFWRRLLEADCNVEEALRHIARQYNVPEAVLVSDMEQIIKTLLKNRLLRKVKSR